MNRKIFFVSAATLALAVSAWGLFRRLPGPLGAYPDRESLGEIGHLHLEGPDHRGHRQLALISWSWEGGTRQWSALRVNETGRATSFRHLWNYSTRLGTFGNPTVPKEPKRLQALLDRLGPSVPAPPIERVLIVSFLDHGTWTTRLYDRDAVPAPLVEFERLLAGPRATYDGGPVWARRDR